MGVEYQNKKGVNVLMKQCMSSCSNYFSSSVGMQWQLGDWEGLRQLTYEWIEKQEYRAVLSAIVAVAQYQDARFQEADRYTAKALEWGLPRQELAQILTVGALNTLGSANLLTDRVDAAQQAFELSVSIVCPCDAQTHLLSSIRSIREMDRLELHSSDDILRNMRNVSIKHLNSDPRGTDAEGDISETLIRRLMDIIAGFSERLVGEGRGLVVDGVHVFDEYDPFLSGKIANALSYWVTEYSPGSPITKARCEKFRAIMRMCREAPIESWGIYFYLKALRVLHDAGLISECFSFEELNRLRDCLDWRTFVNEADYTLIKKPNNFYGIAYGIALLRFQLGWDNSTHSDRLLEKELDHYEEASSDSGFADETNGKGRFDRYSFLLIAEIANKLYDAGIPLTASMRKWLRASADYVLFNANMKGGGFQYGRSIGAYGDSAFLEILTAAAVHGVLTSDELLPAFGFCYKITQKFLTYWWDEDRQSINIWSNARATDSYRGRHRLFGENLSLLHQHLYCHRNWRPLIANTDLSEVISALEVWTEQLPRAKFIRFTEGGCEKALLTYRDGERRIALPLINGDLHYRQMSYNSIPFISDLFQPVPDMEVPLLFPEIVLDNGSSYITYPCFSGIEYTEDTEKSSISWCFSGGTILTGKYPICEPVFKGRARVDLMPGQVSKTEIIELSEDTRLSSVVMVFPIANTLINESSGRLRFRDLTGSECELWFESNCSVESISVITDACLDSVEGRYTDLYRVELMRPLGSTIELTWCVKYST